MKRKIIIGIIALIIGLVVTLFFIKTDTHIYVGDFSNNNPNPKIDVHLTIDGKLILNDSLSNNPYSSIEIKEKLKCGIHKIKVSSTKVDVSEEKTIFLLPNQFIRVEFYPEVSNGKGKPEFSIDNQFNPFYYE